MVSKFRELVEEVKEEQAITEDLLTEDFGKFARNALLGAGIALGGMQGANALTDYNALHLNHPVTAKYEHGGLGYDAIVKDNYGGHSYGVNQISTRRLNKNKPGSTFDDFMSFLKEKYNNIYEYFERYGGWKGAFYATDKFRAAWKHVAKQEAFQKIYNEFIKDSLIFPVYKRMDAATEVPMGHITTMASTNDAVQETIESCIVQHGRIGGFDILWNVVRLYNPTTAADFIDCVYKYRMKKFPDYKNRYTSELKDVLAHLSSGADIDKSIFSKIGLRNLVNHIANTLKIK